MKTKTNSQPTPSIRCVAKCGVGMGLLLATAMTWGCGSDDALDEAPTIARPLTLQVTETPLEDPDAPAATRTAETTTASFSSFSYCYVANGLSSPESATKGAADGLWTTTSGWPSSVGDGDDVRFYAYANATLQSGDVFLDGGSSGDSGNSGESGKSGESGNSGPSVKMNFTVEETTYSQKDLLVATACDSWNHSKGHLGFTFSHACGAVRFSLSKTAGLADYTVQVKYVKICGIPSSGIYCFNNGTWEQISGNKDFTLKSYDGSDFLPVTADKTYLSADGDYLFLLPQTLTAWNREGAPANAYVEIACKIFDGTSYKVGTSSAWGTAYLPLGITIEKGKINPVNISMGTALRKADGNKYF